MELVYTILRGGRFLLQTALEPLDWASKVLNYKCKYPPMTLRQSVGELNYFEGSGGEHLAYLKLLCNLSNSDRVLDFGCGCGLRAINTTGSGSLLDCREYVGFDINPKAINWCRKHIKKGKFVLGTSGGPLPFEDGSFDIILGKSVFTHITHLSIKPYLSELHRILSPTGRCLLTFFLLNRRPLNGQFTFKYKHEFGAYQRVTRPSRAVAYDEDWLVHQLGKLGFTYDIRYGNWTGNGYGLCYQDMVILRKK